MDSLEEMIIKAEDYEIQASEDIPNYNLYNIMTCFYSIAIL